MSSQDNYGYRDPNYAAQVMLQSQRTGMNYGSLGMPDLGFVTDLNGMDDQTFDPTAADHFGDLGTEYGSAPSPVANPTPATAIPPMPAGPIPHMPAEPLRHVHQAAYANPTRVRPVARNNEGMSGSDVAEAVGMGVSLIGGVLNVWASNQQAKNDVATSQAQAEENAAAAELAKAQKELEDARKPPYGLIIGGGVAVVGVLAGVYVLTKGEKKSKKPKTSGPM